MPPTALVPETLQRAADDARRSVSGALRTGLQLRRALATRRTLATEAPTRLTGTWPSAEVLRRRLAGGSTPRPDMIGSLVRPAAATAFAALHAGDLGQAEWLATALTGLAPADGQGHEVLALLSVERGRPVRARQLFAQSRAIPSDGPRARRWLRAQHQRTATRSVMMRLAGLEAVPADDPVLLWAAAERHRGVERLRLQAAAVAAAARAGTGEDTALWCRRFLLARAADGLGDPVGIRADIDAEVEVVRQPAPDTRDPRFVTVLPDGDAGLAALPRGPGRATGPQVTLALYLPDEQHERELADVLRTLRARPRRDDVEVVLVHTALDPATVGEAFAADPAMRFLRAERGMLDAVRPDAAAHPRRAALAALALTGRRRIVIAPAHADTAATVAALALEDADVPTTAVRDDVLPDTGVLVVDGALAAPGPDADLLPELLACARDGEATGFAVLPRLRDRLVLQKQVAPDVGFLAYSLGSTEHGGPGDAALWEATGVAMDAVDNAGAAAAVDAAIGRPRQASERIVPRWSRALHRSSDYARAVEVLALAGDRDAADVAAAETAWVTNDRLLGRAHADALARRDPGHPRSAGLRARAEAAEPALRPGVTNLVHVAAYIGRGGNYGDRVLPTAVRDAVSSAAGRPLHHLPVHAHRLFDDARRELADRSAGVIVGGGGLFLPDTAPNGTSGWQWNVPTEQLRRLDVPLGLVAVGFNVFRGQSVGGSLFRQSLEAVVDRADLVGLRNHGSIRQVRSLLPTRLADKIEYLPCPTTVLAVLHPELAAPVARHRSVLLNAAYDRSARRFGDTYGAFLAQIDAYVRALRADGVDVRAVSHMAPDEQLATDLRREHGLELDVVRLNVAPLDEARTAYREAGVVVGMRGHATMIPFGLRTPVLSLVSHPKMRYFLDDIDHPEWGFEVTERFGDALLERTRDVLARPDAYVGEVVAAQQMLATAVREPLERFCAILR
ncbi:polysaccharide pyruvyl transferase family protein [Jatrophihabitans fulvus]